MKRHCAVCGSSCKKTLYQQRFEAPSANAVHLGYDVVLCADCGFAYADNTPEQAALDAYYGKTTRMVSAIPRSCEGTHAAHNGNWEHLLPSDLPSDLIRQRHSAQTILAYLRHGDRCLDIGCGTGYLLALLREQGCEKVVGLDPSELCCRVARDKYGIEAHCGSLFELPEIGTFDFLILNHVLEHVADLPDFVLRLHRLMRPDAQLYIEVPDAHAFALCTDANVTLTWEYARDLFAQFGPEHINFFSRVSLQNLMTRLGFQSRFLESQVSVMGVIASIWTQTDIQEDRLMEDRLLQYIERSRAMFSSPLAVIDEIVHSGQEVFVWGAGLHTQRLLACGNLEKARIHAFIDSNPAYHGQQLSGRPILDPKALGELPPLPILISSRRSQDAIERQIVDSGIKNPLVLLYPRQG